MRVLGIDAAWTTRNPSGVALIERTAGAWRLVAAEPSYTHFLAWGAGRRLDSRPTGTNPDASALIDACGEPPDLVAVDMPLAREPIVARRASDNAITRAYGGRQAGTHSPSAIRPGPIADALRLGFARAGFDLWTVRPDRLPALIEVYPHPALIELTGAPRRLCYKLAKTGKYWPATTLPDRKVELASVWTGIIGALDERVDGVKAAFHGVAPSKAAEDMLDAVICAWVGACVLEQRATSFGDDSSAIWVPRGADLHVATQ